MHRLLKWLLLAIILIIAVGAIVYYRQLKPRTATPFVVEAPLTNIRMAPMLDLGPNFAAMVAPNGTLWAWAHLNSIPGIPQDENPHQISSEPTWKSVAAGFFGMVALQTNGTIWALGMNSEGVLGITNQNASHLVQIGSDHDWVDIQAAVGTCFALKLDGSLWSWGRNGYGETGHGRVSTVELPARVGTNTNWNAITAGDFTGYGLQEDGSLWGWGNFPNSVTVSSPQRISTATNWIAISAGSYHLAGLKTDGSIWIMGSNAGILSRLASSSDTNWTQLGKSNDWVEIRSGGNSLLARNRSGTWHYFTTGKKSKWGKIANDGSYEIFPISSEPLDIRTVGETTLILMPDGRLWSLGGRIGAPDQVSGPLMTRLIIKIANFFGKGLPVPVTRVQDETPYLIWKQE